MKHPNSFVKPGDIVYEDGVYLKVIREPNDSMCTYCDIDGTHLCESIGEQCECGLNELIFKKVNFAK